MKKILGYSLLILPFGIFFSCSTEPENHVEYHLLRVDSLQHPRSVALNDTIKLVLTGFAGPDGCNSFSHIESLHTPSSVDLKVWGKEVLGAVCLMVVLPFREEYNTIAQKRGKYSINISQPDGSLLEDSVIVF